MMFIAVLLELGWSAHHHLWDMAEEFRRTFSLRYALPLLSASLLRGKGCEKVKVWDVWVASINWSLSILAEIVRVWLYGDEAEDWNGRRVEFSMIESTRYVYPIGLWVNSFSFFLFFRLFFGGECVRSVAHLHIMLFILFYSFIIIYLVLIV